MKRLEFTDKQKALIYERDKWLCAFSWKILWILHYWSSILWDSDWVDHIKPAMKWWDNSIENWICASSFYNSKKKDNGHDNKFFFINWKPTEDFYFVDWKFTKELWIYLRNMNRLHYSDWYFNRILKNIMISVNILNNPYDLKWNLVKRTEIYWCKAWLKKLKEWKKIIKKENIEDFLIRLNIDSKELWEDQKIMLEIINSEETEDLLEISKKLLPFYKNSVYFFWKIKNIKNLLELEEIEKLIKDEKFIWLQDKKILLKSLNNLKIIY